MIATRVTLGEYRQIIREKGSINDHLKSKGFNMDKDWSKGTEFETGDYIFMQAVPQKNTGVNRVDLKEKRTKKARRKNNE